MRNLSGREASRVMVESIGNEIGLRSARRLDRKVRERMPAGGNFHDWLEVVAQVIVEDGDTKADKGFTAGLRRIRQLAGQDA